MTPTARFYLAGLRVALIFAGLALLFWFLTTVPYSQP